MAIDLNRKNHIKGVLGELGFAFKMIDKGWKVFTPIDQNSRIDMIIEQDGKLLKIQVKYCTPYRGCLRVDLERRFRNTKPFNKDDLDAVGIFDASSNKCYLVPFKIIFPRQGIWLRIKETSNKQKKGIHWAREYEV